MEEKAKDSGKNNSLISCSNNIDTVDSSYSDGQVNNLELAPQFIRQATIWRWQ